MELKNTGRLFRIEKSRGIVLNFPLKMFDGKFYPKFRTLYRTMYTNEHENRILHYKYVDSMKNWASLGLDFVA